MLNPSSSDSRVFDDTETLARASAEWLCDRALESQGRFAVSLSGGSTPKPLYECLASSEVAARFPWTRVHWFWGDERFVPHDHPDSNFGMAWDAFLSRVPIPPENIHAIPTQPLSPQDAAAAYEETLKRAYGADTLAADRPLFDVNLLGIGTNGHTASLFPGDGALRETRRWVLPVIGAMPDARITLTYPALNSSRDTVFVVSGANKRDVVARARAGDASLPAAEVRPIGRLHWFMDRAAGGRGEDGRA